MHLVTLLLLQCFNYSEPGSVQNSWQIDKQKDGITVYTRLLAGSEFKAFKAIMTVDASINKILDVLKKADAYTDWYGYTKSSRILLQEQSVQYNYVETIFPWRYANRDMVYRMSFHLTDPEEVRINLEGVPDYTPPNEGIVRMLKAEGFIVLKAIDEHTEIIYQFHSEPGDGIPSWLANASIAELPFQTLSGLRSILNQH